jgi:hypothetical protein
MLFGFIDSVDKKIVTAGGDEGRDAVRGCVERLMNALGRCGGLLARKKLLRLGRRSVGLNAAPDAWPWPLLRIRASITSHFAATAGMNFCVPHRSWRDLWLAAPLQCRDE